MSRYTLIDDDMFLAVYHLAAKKGKTCHWVAKELGIGVREVVNKSKYLRSRDKDVPYLIRKEYQDKKQYPYHYTIESLQAIVDSYVSEPSNE